MELPKTITDFKTMVWSKSKGHLDKYPIWFQRAFVKYWLEIPDCENKCRYFLLSKDARRKWSTLGRMATCKRMFYANDPRWVQTKKETYTPPEWHPTYSGRKGEVQKINEIIK